MEKPLEIELGMMAHSIARQVNKQGYKYNSEKMREFQRQAEAISLLYYGDLMTDSAKTKLNKKLFIKIMKHVKDLNP